MAKLDYLVLHMSQTKEGREVTKEEIQEWHMGPKDSNDGSVRYMNKTYESRGDLPEDKINGKYIENIKGNGWSKYGYSDILHIDGSIENLTAFNQDGSVDGWEVSYGAKGINGRSRHFCYIGGLREEIIDDHWEIADTRTLRQLYGMEVYIRYMILRHPDIQVAGHNQFSTKTCPGFNVPHWLKLLGIQDKNIYNGSKRK